MNCAGLQPWGKAVGGEVLPSKYDIPNRVVVRQHGDDHLAREQFGDIGCRLETERREPFYLLGTPDIGDNLTSRGSKVCGHCRPHVTKTDKADFNLHGLAVA